VFISPILRKYYLAKKTYTSKYIQAYDIGIHMIKTHKMCIWIYSVYMSWDSVVQYT